MSIKKQSDKQRTEWFNTGLYLISLSDYGLETKRLKQAIAELEQIIYVRENVPF